MIHECTYCTFQSSYKSNLKSHMKSKHNDKIPIEKDEGKSMKNQVGWWLLVGCLVCTLVLFRSSPIPVMLDPTGQVSGQKELSVFTPMLKIAVLLLKKTTTVNKVYCIYFATYGLIISKYL